MHSFKSRMLWCASLLLIFTLCNYSCQPGQTNDTTNASELKIDYEKYKLDNGLEVILHQDDSDPIVAVSILFNVGSNREKPGRTGFAHFFEHMLFQNSENVGKGNFFKIIEDLGGDFNGGTWTDGTIYYEVIPKDALERILWMESDRMGFMINTVTEAVLENEKEVVKNEKRQRVDNQPYGHTSYVISKALYPEGHPYNWQTIGSLEDLQAATISDVKEFYDKWYGPNNATMVIAGDINKAEVKELVEKYFGEIPAKDAIDPINPTPGAVAETTLLMHEDNFAELPELNLVWPTVQDGHPDMYALDILGQLLSQGKRAPFFKEIVEEKKLAPSTSTFNSSSNIAGYFRARVRANKDTDLNVVRTAVFDAFKRFEESGIDDRDMERIKNTLETDFYSGISSILGKAWQLAQYNEFRGNPDELQEEIQKVLDVTKEDVMRVYETYVKNKPYIATSFVPKGKPELALEGSVTAAVEEEEIIAGAEAPPLPEIETEFEKTPSQIDRTVVPELGESPTSTSPTIWTAELGNGLDVFGIENKELPLVEFSLRIKGGMTLDTPTKVGVANLITDVMMEGTANKTPEELQDAIGQLGADISMFTSSEHITITGSTLVRNFDKLMAIFEEVLLEPRWDTKEFDRIKASTITQIQQRKSQPNVIASGVFRKLIYGDNMLANDTYGSIESVESITIDDLKAYYEANYSPSISSFHVVGAVSEAQVKGALKSIEEKWASKPVDVPAYAAPEKAEKPALYFVDIPNSKQSVVFIGSPMLKGNDPDYYAATVVNQRLGVGTSARLFQQLREERGYTYGAYSFMPRRINTSIFGASSSVRSNVTKESVELFKEILEGYQADYSAEDLEKTKTSLLRSNARAFETLYDKLSILQNISTFDLPQDYIKKEEQVVMNMTLDQAKEIIGKYIDPSKFVYLVVGDAATQADRLKEVGIGNPIMLDKEGVPVEAVPN